jgi:hypothetical protein
VLEKKKTYESNSFHQINTNNNPFAKLSVPKLSVATIVETTSSSFNYPSISETVHQNNPTELNLNLLNNLQFSSSDSVDQGNLIDQIRSVSLCLNYLGFVFSKLHFRFRT